MAEKLLRQFIAALPRADASSLFRGSLPETLGHPASSSASRPIDNKADSNTRASLLSKNPLDRARAAAAAALILRLLPPTAAQVALRLAVSQPLPEYYNDTVTSVIDSSDVDSSVDSCSGSVLLATGLVPWLLGQTSGSTHQRNRLLRAKRLLNKLIKMHVLVPVGERRIGDIATAAAAEKGGDTEMRDGSARAQTWNWLNDEDAVAVLRGLPVRVQLQSDLHTALWSALFEREDLGTLAGVSAAGPLSVLCPRSSRPDSRQPSADELEAFVTRTWDGMLHFLIGAPQQELPAEIWQFVIVDHGLMDTEDDETSLRINSAGFQFLLKDRETQAWLLLLEYARSGVRGVAAPSVLLLLIQLSELHIGVDYDIEETVGSNPAYKEVIGDFCGFGLLWRRSVKSNRFYVTPLAGYLRVGSLNEGTAAVQGIADPDITEPETVFAAETGPGTHLLTPSDERGYIVVETNFRVYAYTESPLQISLLRLFVTVVYQLPGMVMGLITRESVRVAVRNGITADQIIQFLRQHMHPQARAQAAALRTTVVPENVSDQLKLWEAERNRISTTKSILYSNFESYALFEHVLHAAIEHNGLIWPSMHSTLSKSPIDRNNAATWKMAVQPFAHEILKGVIGRFKKEHGL